MKFAYVDESGSGDEGDVFVVAAVLLDAYRLRKYTIAFDGLLTDFMNEQRGAPKELKTKAFINGSGGWSKVDADARKKFLTQVCNIAAECATIFATGISFEKFRAVEGAPKSIGKSYWLAGMLFVAAHIQQKMQDEHRNKGLTVLICDDNKHEMANLSDALYEADPWFDPLYQNSRRKQGKVIWDQLSDDDRFDHIINTGFAIKSHHSSLVQVADAVAYVYRRYLELKGGDKPSWEGETDYYDGLVKKLDGARKRLGRRPDAAAIDFYLNIKHNNWIL